MTTLERVGQISGTVIADVVFIHGLGGHKRDTWQNDKKSETFWPAWLADDMKQVAVWTLGYDADPSAWFGSAMPLGDRARNILELLAVEGLGDRQVVFVCHSLGGLVAKQMLRTADGYGDASWRLILDQVRGIVFLATPHAGSRLADYVGALGRLLRITTVTQQLEAHAEPLRDLNLWYRNNARRLRVSTRVFFETSDTRGIRVVDETSADPGMEGVVPRPIDADHFAICKPSSREDLLHKSVKTFITECISPAGGDEALKSVTQATNAITQTKAGAAADRPYRFFISYRRSAEDDTRLAQYLRENLERSGHEVFIDIGMPVGTDWSAEINHRIVWCDFLVVLLSAESAHSEMVQAEVRLAHQSRKADGRPAILPVRVAFEGTLDYELDSYLSRLQYVIWRAPGDEEHVLKELHRSAGADPRSLISASAPGASDSSAAPQDRRRPTPGADRRVLKRPGGTLKPDDPFYLSRTADEIVDTLATDTGCTLVIKGPRQVGKSSLLVRYLSACQQAGKRWAFLDLQGLTDLNLADLQTFLVRIAETILKRLKLPPMDAGLVFEPLQLTAYIEERVVPQVTGPLVFAFDEVDRVLGRPWQKDFFSMLRMWHNRRAEPFSVWEQVDLALVIATEPYILIDAKDQSPFNVGEVVTLAPFERPALDKLNTLYDTELDSTQLDRLFELTGGQPYLTRTAFYRFVSPDAPSFGELVEQAALDSGPFGDHLKSKLLLLHRAGLAEAAGHVLRYSSVPNNDRTIFYRLHGAGLVRQDGKRVIPANLLYARFFKETL